MAEEDTENKVAVVIPLYKEIPSESEILSLERAFSIFRDRKIILICPGNLNLKNYRQYKAEVLRFPSGYFKSQNTYNRLLLKKEFYERFSSFDYILIYQTDAYVFSDDLTYWCNKNFDYIGAPWTVDHKPDASLGFVSETGNGGFSLRKVSSFIRILSLNVLIHDKKYFIDKYNLNNILSRIIFYPFIKLKKAGFRNNIRFLICNYKHGEDKFWAFEARKFDNSFRVAGLDEALGFSFEMAPEILYKMNSSRLPFGCHAFKKHDPEFWQQFIEGN